MEIGAVLLKLAIALTAAMPVISFFIDFTTRLKVTGADIFLSTAVALCSVRPLTQDSVFIATGVTLEQASPNTHPLPIGNGFKFIIADTALGPGTAIGDLGPPYIGVSIHCASVTLKLAKPRLSSWSSWHHSGVYTALVSANVYSELYGATKLQTYWELYTTSHTMDNFGQQSSLVSGFLTNSLSLSRLTLR